MQEFLDDPHPDIQACGAGVVDQLLSGGAVQLEAAAGLLTKIESHQNPEVRKRAEFVRSYLAGRSG